MELQIYSEVADKMKSIVKHGVPPPLGLTCSGAQDDGSDLPDGAGSYGPLLSECQQHGHSRGPSRLNGGYAPEASIAVAELQSFHPRANPFGVSRTPELANPGKILGTRRAVDRPFEKYHCEILQASHRSIIQLTFKLHF